MRDAESIAAVRRRYWATAVTVAHSLSFAGIVPAGALAFIAAQLIGMMAAVGVGAWLWPKPAKSGL